MKSSTNKVSPAPSAQPVKQPAEKGAEEAASTPPPPGPPPPGPPPGQPELPWREDPDYDPFSERVVRLPYS